MDGFDLSNRDNWKDRAALYKDGSRLCSQNNEDMIARKILRGLGYTEKGINKLESALELAYDPAKPLFDRVKTCLEIVSRGMFSSDRAHRRFALTTRDTDDTHSMIIRHMDEWIQMAEPEKEGVVVMSRVGKDRRAWGYVIMRETLLPVWILQHPAVLIRRADGWWVWYREVTDLVYDMARFEHWDVPGSAVFDSYG